MNDITRAIHEALSSNSSPVVLDLRYIVGGKHYHQRHPKNNRMTLEGVKKALADIGSDDLNRIQVFDISRNHISNEDLPHVVDVLDMLPNVYELDLSACSICTAKAKDIQLFTRRPTIKRVYIYTIRCLRPLVVVKCSTDSQRMTLRR